LNCIAIASKEPLLAPAKTVEQCPGLSIKYTYKFIPYNKKPDCRFAIEINRKGRAFSDPAFQKRQLVISSFDRLDGESGLHLLKSRKDIQSN
jgi:hypothetical protein